MLKDEKLTTTVIIPNLTPLMEMITQNLFRPRSVGGGKKNIGISESGVEAVTDDGNPSFAHFIGIYQIYQDLVYNFDVEGYMLKDFLKPRYL
jgi:hypothetical protein